MAVALKHAIGLAIDDRNALMAAYAGVGAEAEEARAAVRDLLALKGVKPSQMSAGQLDTARLALVWAEQHLDEVVRCESGTVARDAWRLRKRLRAARLAQWGKTAFESYCENATTVDVMDCVTSGRPMGVPS